MRFKGVINWAMLVRILGLLLLFEAAFMVVPAIVGLFTHEYGASRAFGLSGLFTLLCGLLIYIFVRPVSKDMGRREGIMLTALVWVVFSLFGLIPYMLAPTTQLSFSASFFEAMSGFTTTGASLIESADQLSYAVHIWRFISQWIGGLGIIIFTIALLPLLNSSGGMQMCAAEQNKIADEKIRPRISSSARRLWIVYCLLTLALFLLLWGGPMNAFDAACYAMSTMSTGGFATSSAGIDAYNSVYVKCIITLFMFLGGVNFAMVYRASTGQWRPIFHNEAFLTYCKVILGAFIVMVLCALLNSGFRDWENVTIDPLFQVVSLITSTGFMLPEFVTWGQGALFIGLLLIVVGGCAGSTSGGAKIDRVVYLLKYLRNEILRTLRPNSIRAVRVNGRTVPSDRMNTVVAFLCLYVGVSVIGALMLTFVGVPLVEAMIVSIGAIGNDSLTSNDALLGCDYLSLRPAAHFILSFIMLTGRLEIYTILILFSREFWHK